MNKEVAYIYIYTNNKAMLWRQPNSPSTYECIKRWHIYIYTNTHWNIIQPQETEILPFATIWMDIEDIMLCEINQTERQTLRFHLHVESEK